VTRWPANNDAIIHNGNLTSLWQNVQTGYNGGNWNGTGITSSSAHGDTKHLTALGIISNNNGIGQPLFTNFEGQTAAASDVLIKYTYYGDATLDGSVNSADYTRIDAAFLANHNSGQNLYTGWSNGDFNYDGVINGSDYTLIDNAFNQQGGQIAAQIASPTAQLAGTITAVPEPSVVMGFGICALALLGRRNRKPTTVD
jgi:Dockerin type I domain/PEP-CTERM motif